MAKRTTRSVALPVHKQVRCAIYTRKSTDEGLDQSFNSLDAQREACAAYIISQRHEGWIPVGAAYDDGGFSGGNMDRPGLRGLLADIESGRVDVIVVYKVDRLTRSLADFAKIVDVLDARGASFVSVTQAFNTTTSMGRLTLNVLLSFAQFEREVTGERIRDKIAASKKKGMWMGGPVPLGYDVQDRKLIVNHAEAETVRLVFARHQELGTIRALVDDLGRRQVLSKVRRMRDGRVTGGVPYTAGPLTHLLRNVIYTGRIPHHENLFAGEHAAIVEQALWDASQELLDGNAPRPHTGHTSLLNGLVYDMHGRRMTPAHAIKGERRYRYYVSQLIEGQTKRAWRLPAGDLEKLVTEAIQEFLFDPRRLAAEVGQAAASASLMQAGATLAEKVSEPKLLRQLGLAVTVGQDQIEIELNAEQLASLLGADHIASPAEQRIQLTLATSLKRRGHELRLIYAARDANPSSRDERLIRLVASGYAAYEQLRAGEGSGTATQRSHLARLARLKFLDPSIVASILDGRQPVHLTSRMLLRISELPLSWGEQRVVLQFS